MYSQIIDKLYQQTLENNIKAAKQCLEDTNKIIPVDTGELKASGKVVIANNKAEVVYTAPHAIYAHEIPTHTGYKFLERTVDSNRNTYHKIIRGGKS